MNIRVFPSQLKGAVTPPASKSFAHRALIAAFLSGEPTVLRGRVSGRDVEATITALRALGAEITVSDNQIVLNGTQKPPNNEVTINAGESGSTLRFLLPVCAAIGAEVEFKGEGRLPERPLSGLNAVLKRGGANLSSDSLPLKVSGKMTSGIYRIDGSVSSQYVTGLLLALPILPGDNEIILENGLQSASYVDITLSVLRDFGITVEKTKQGFFVPGGQRFRAPSEFAVETDWSSAAFMLGGGVLAGDVLVRGLNPESKQGDRKIAELLAHAGADIAWEEGGLRARKSSLCGIDFDCGDCPDIAPIMAVILASAKGESTITGTNRLRVKESDRLLTTVGLLWGLGISSRQADNALTIVGGRLKGAEFSGGDDHRIAMSAIIGALAAEGESVVLGAECVDKSYPGFLGDISLFGGNYELL